MKQSIVFQPKVLADSKLKLRNRIIMAPMTRRKADPLTFAPTTNMVQYYARRAAGGVGLIITEGTHLSSIDAGDGSAVPQCITPQQVEGWKKVVDAVHEADGKIALQLWHRGLFSLQPIGPSGVPIPGKPGSKGREATEKDMDRILQDFVAMATTAVISCGFDAVELHGAHGYFLDSFLSPVLNQRTDEYGGSVANRARYPAKVVSAIRAALGPDVPILYRFSQWIVYDYQHIKFANSQELLEFFSVVGSAGVTAFHVSCRRITAPGFPQEHPTRTLAGWTKLLLKTSEAAQINNLSRIEVIGVGSVSLSRMLHEKAAEGEDQDQFEVVDPAPGLQLVETGEIDYLAIGRPLWTDPAWVEKVSSGKWKDLTPFTKKSKL